MMQTTLVSHCGLCAFVGGLWGTCWGPTDCTVCPWPLDLLCLPNHMQASVSRSYLQSLGYSVWDLVILNWNGSSLCQSRITSSRVTFTIPYTGCGTIKQVSLGLPTPSPAEQAIS